MFISPQFLHLRYGNFFSEIQNWRFLKLIQEAESSLKAYKKQKINEFAKLGNQGPFFLQLAITWVREQKKLGNQNIFYSFGESE